MKWLNHREKLDVKDRDHHGKLVHACCDLHEIRDDSCTDLHEILDVSCFDLHEKQLDLSLPQPHEPCTLYRQTGPFLLDRNVRVEENP